MKSLVILTVLFSAPAFASKKCAVVVFGGSKSWISLMPGLPTDISIDVARQINSEAGKTNCDVLEFSNDIEEDFLNKLKKLKEYPAGASIHMSFADHGTGGNYKDPLQGFLITGLGQATTNAKFMNALKENLPKDSHVTYQTNSCWPGISEAIIASGLDSKVDICGGSSTSKYQMSYNLHVFEKPTGAYGAVGFNYANDYQKKNRKYPSMFDVHEKSKLGDAGNINRQPGLTTSLSFAQMKLEELKKPNPLGTRDLMDVMNDIQWKNNEALEAFLKQGPAVNVKVAENYLNQTCTQKSSSPYDTFLNFFAKIYNELLNNNFDTLPDPYAKMANESLMFLKQNQKKLAELIAKNAKEQALFIKKNQLTPRKKYAEVEKDWQTLKAAQTKSLLPYLSQFRTLQESKMIQSFNESASPADKLRFQKLIECEKKPFL